MGVVSLIVVLALAVVLFYVWSITSNFWALVSAAGIVLILLLKFIMK